MNRYLLIAFLTGLPLMALQAQRDVLTRGGDYSSSGGSVAFSIGQIGYTYLTGEAGSASLGVQQPIRFNIVATDDVNPLWEVSLYPNPASENVYIDLKDDDVLKNFNALYVRLFDLQGKLVVEKKITEIVTAFPLSGFAESMYLLQILQDQQPLKSFKLYKSN
jgi:hypothetical protein